ncbi:MAG: hypothetical protein ABI134_21150, partial [Byssovorax sp.]
QLLALPGEERFHEIIDGELVRKARPSGEHVWRGRELKRSCRAWLECGTARRAPLRKGLRAG